MTSGPRLRASGSRYPGFFSLRLPRLPGLAVGLAGAGCARCLGLRAKSAPCLLSFFAADLPRASKPRGVNAVNPPPRGAAPPPEPESNLLQSRRRT